MEGQKPRVIVLSRNYSTALAVVRSVGAAGYTVDLIACTKKKGSSKIVSTSKYIRDAIEVLIPETISDSGERLKDAILERVSESEKQVLFPTDDYTMSVLANYRKELEKFFVMPSIAKDSQYSYAELINKEIQGELARKAGLLTPLEWVISLKEESAIPEEMVYPCFVKPLESVRGVKDEMKKCSSKEELQEWLNYLSGIYAERSVVVQEFLDIETEYDMSGICLKQEVFIPGIIRKRRIAQYEKGVTLSGEMQPFEALGEISEKIIQMMKSYCYTGMFDLELNVCGDKVYFNEVNLRSGGPNYAYFKSGVNLPAIVVKFLAGKESEQRSIDDENYGKTFVYEKVAWEDYMRGYMSKSELREVLAKADFGLLCDPQDSKPGKVFQTRIRLSAIKYKVRKLLKRV